VPASYSQYFWVLYFFGWGYADNQPNTLDDRVTPNIDGCGIDIAWAVDEQRQPVSLDFVDFVRVYTGINQKCGWLLETSTEILGAEDLHLDASLQAIRQAATSVPSLHPSPFTLHQIHDLQGRLVPNPTKGLYIRNRQKYIIK